MNNQSLFGSGELGFNSERLFLTRMMFVSFSFFLWSGYLLFSAVSQDFVKVWNDLS